MSLKHTETWAPLPSTTRAVPVHLSYDPKSDRLAYANGKSIFLRDVEKTELVYQFVDHNFKTTVAKFSPSGYYVASADEAGNVKVWDAVGEDHTTKGDFNVVISGRINDIAWDSDSKRVIAVGDGKERFGHCFTFDSGNTVGEISGHSAPINAVAIKPTRPFRAATVGDDGALVFLSAPPYKFVSSIRNKHSNFVRDLTYSNDGDYIVSVSADKKIVVYDGKTGEFLKYVCDPKLGDFAHESGIFGVSWLLPAQSKTQFVTCSSDSTVKLWDVETGELIKTWDSLPKCLENHHLGVVSTNKYIITVTYNGNLNYFSLDSDKPLKIVKGHQKVITAMCTVSDNHLVTGSYDGRIVDWDLSKKLAEYFGGEGHTNLVNDIVSDGHNIVTSGWDDKLINVKNGRYLDDSVLALDSQPKKMSSINTKDQAAIVTNDSELLIVDIKSNDVVMKKKLDFDVSSSIDITDKLAIVGDDKTFNVSFYSLENELCLLPEYQLKLSNRPTYIKISPDSKFVAVGDSAGKIVLFDIVEKTIKTSRWGFHSAKINSISWRSDSKYVVSGSLDTNIIIYSVDKPIRNVKSLKSHKEGVNTVEWINDNTVVSAGGDSAIKFWDVKLS